jgi:nitroimidazol reductase NimA-like FMN-containing flavoprotein (pyridoxamine 5'-phosphate oxidase superfamily)
MNAMTKEQITAMLSRSPVGTLATANADGAPYSVPVHFVMVDGKVCVHCGYHGQKLENMRRNGRVCFTVWEMFGLRHGKNDEPCSTGTDYESVIITGIASVMEDPVRKRAILGAFAVKYMPGKNADSIPDEAVLQTCVIEIEPVEITSKRK